VRPSSFGVSQGIGVGGEWGGSGDDQPPRMSVAIAPKPTQSGPLAAILGMGVP